MKRLFKLSDQPDFLVKSTLGIALMAIILVTPFAFIQIFHGNYLLGSVILLLTSICIINALLCYQGNYHLGLNLFGVVPAVTLATLYGIVKVGMVATYWPYMGVLAFHFSLPERQAWIVNILFILIISPFAWQVLDTQTAIRFTAVLFGVSFFAFLSMREIFKQHRMLIDMSNKDPLTGLYNRLNLHDVLSHAIAQNSRTNIPMSIIMLDIDLFKQINDSYGHEIGDSILESIGKIMTEFFRVDDLLFRIGGEEFLVLMHNTDEANSHKIAEQLREHIEQLPLLKDRPLTVSIGVAGLSPNLSIKSWMKECDDNLYFAKNNGRNQVISQAVKI